MSIEKKQNFTIPFFSPADLLKVSRHFSCIPGTCLLFSGGTFDSATHSFLSLFPKETATIFGNRLIVKKKEGTSICQVENPWKALEPFFSENNKEFLFGWFGYGMRENRSHSLSLEPDAYWQSSAVVVSLDHTVCEAHVTIDSEFIPVEWIDFLTNPEGWKDLIQKPFANQVIAPQGEKMKFPEVRGSFIDKVRAIQELIREGEVYQVNLAHRFTLPFGKDPFSVFSEMALKNPAPFSAFFCIDDFTLVSTSPERFLCKKGKRLETRPIKGTAPRGETDEADLMNRAELLASEKENAELLMITDLMRNDLGKISESGSVKVVDLRRCEAYTNVFHLLSVIESTVKQIPLLDIIRSCFPPGSVTGCPKKRAIEVIETLEESPRGVYTGSLGYFSPNGDFDLNVVIRTVLFFKERCELSLGSGIVIESVPEKEYEEILHKGRMLFDALSL